MKNIANLVRSGFIASALVASPIAAASPSHVDPYSAKPASYFAYQIGKIGPLYVDYLACAKDEIGSDQFDQYKAMLQSFSPEVAARAQIDYEEAVARFAKTAPSIRADVSERMGCVEKAEALSFRIADYVKDFNWALERGAAKRDATAKP